MTEYNDYTQARRDWCLIRTKIFSEIMNDMAYFNRNPECKNRTKKRSQGNNFYTREYYDELMADLDSEWFRAYVGSWGMRYDQVYFFAVTNTKGVYTGDLELVDVDDCIGVAKSLERGLRRGHGRPEQFKVNKKYYK
jgi:hypothetical protein